MIRSHDLLSFSKFINSQGFLSAFSGVDFENIFANINLQESDFLKNWNTKLTLNHLEQWSKWHLFSFSSEVLVYQSRDLGELLIFINKLKNFFYSSRDTENFKISWNYFGNQELKDKYWEYLYNWFWQNQDSLAGPDSPLGAFAYQEILLDISKLLQYQSLYDFDFLLPSAFWSEEIYKLWLGISKNLGETSFNSVLAFNTLASLQAVMQCRNYHLKIQIQRNCTNSLTMLILVV